MSHLNPGLFAAYNSLTDKHLSGYFNNVRIRRHLQKVGLITRSGRIVPDKEYKHKLIQRAHQKHVRECLAQAIFHKVLDMERLHQTEIKRKLEEFAQRERIHKMKVERSRRCDDEPMLMLSPRPPTRPKISQARHTGPEGDNSESTESPGSSRPNTAPGNIQRPVRLKPLNSNSATTSLRRTSPRYRLRERDSSNDTDQPLSYLLDKDTMRQTAMTDFSSAISPYRLPVINNYVTPVPPLTKKRDRGTRTNGTHRGRKLRPTTAPTEPPTALQRTSAQNKVSVNMVYFGKSVHLSHDQMDLRDEVKVYQQHCGGENLCVFKGRLIEGETFQLVSRRHQGFPFSLTFFLNGLQVERLSSCCEFKHRKGSRLGGRHGHFGFCSVEGASPCYKCIIAMGLDKKPTPPVRRVKEEPPASKSPDEKETTDVDEDVETRSNTEPCASQERENDHNGDTEEQKKHYEEDFEADDEGPVEDGENVEENQKEKSSITNDGVKETESMDEHDQSENNKDSDSEIEDDKVKRSPSVSSGRTSSLSSIDNSEREIEEDTKDDTAVVPDETFNVQPEEDLTTAKMEESSSVTLPQASEEDSETQDKSEKEMSEEHVEGEEAREEAKPDDNPEEPETERATSIQEKLAEAILKESQTCSEPELSDTSTEEDEGASVKTQQDSQGAEVESVVGFASPQPPNPLEDISEENKANTHEDEFIETSHDDDKTGQPESVDTNTETPNTPKDDEESQSMKNEEVPANLDEKQEVEVSETTNEAERQDKQEDAQTKEEEPHDETLNNGNIDHKDITEIESPLPEKAEEPMIEKDGLLSNTENNKKTGDTEKKADDADHSNERPDRDERDDLTDEAGLAEEKVQETGGVTDDACSVYKLEDVENPSEEKVNSAVEDMKDGVPIEEDDKVDVEEVTEKVEGEDESKDHEVEVAGKANEEEKENEGAKDLNKENEDEKNGENESGQAENTENKDQDMTETETEEEKLDVQELSQKEEPEDSLNDDIVEEIEKVNNEMMREQKRNENEVEEGIRVEMAEREGENVTKDLKHEDEEEKKEEEHINKIGDGENDENKEAISGENVTQKPEDIEQNGGLVLQGEQNETPDDDNELQEVNKDLPAGNIDAENGERQEDDRNVENHLQDETQDKPEEETVGPVQNVTDDETKSENDEDVREEKDVEVSSEKVVDDKSMMEEVDKESETSARTFIENKVPEETLEETTNKSPVGEDTTDEHNDIETEPKATDNDMSDFPEESKPEEPLENKSIEEDGRSTSHSVKSQPVENIFKKKERTLSIDSEETRSAVSDKANGVDLVSNWINVHQASRYFQTFIEPLDEIKESSISDETEKDQNSEVLDANDTQSTDETATQVQSENNDSTGHDTIVENLTENKPEDLEDNASQEDKAKESGENKESLVTKSSGQSHEDDEMDRREHSTVHDVTNQTDKTEVQDLASDLNANSQEETEPNRQQTPIEEMIQSETIGKEIQDSSNHNLKSEPEPLSEYIEPQSPTITVITDLMVIHKPENGSQDDTASVDVHSRESDGNRRTNVIDTHFKQSDGNDTLSTFSLDDSRFFGPAGYPRLTTAHTENSY